MPDICSGELGKDCARILQNRKKIPFEVSEMRRSKVARVEFFLDGEEKAKMIHLSCPIRLSRDRKPAVT
jgi:hypothetical protein